MLTVIKLIEEYTDKLEVAKIILDNVIECQKESNVIRIIVPDIIIGEILSIVKNKNFVASKFSENYGFKSGKVYEFIHRTHNELNHADHNYSNISVPICSMNRHESV